MRQKWNFDRFVFVFFYRKLLKIGLIALLPLPIFLIIYKAINLLFSILFIYLFIHINEQRRNGR